MKITKLDRRRAIWRFPEFQKDLERYKKLKSPGQRVKFSIESSVKWKDEFEAIVRAEDQADLWSHTKKNDLLRFKERGNVEAVTEITAEPYFPFFTDEVRKGNKEPIRKIFKLSGNSLYLKIKLEGKRLDDIIDECREVASPYHIFVNPPGSKRERKTDITKKDIWDVYDLYQKTGENMTETTRQLFKLQGQHYYDWSDTYLKRTKKAVDNAIVIIETVRKELSLMPLFPDFITP